MNNQFLAGKVAAVTGGTRGIGRAIASALVGAGASVAICGRSAEGVAAAVEELKGQAGSNGAVAGCAADVRVLEDVRRFLAFTESSFGGLDILVNNAGLGIFAPAADLTPESWHTTIETNLTAVFYCCHEAIPMMRRRGGGHIVNISSLAGQNPFAGGAAYNASKFALNGFSEAMMLDHRNEDIRVTCIKPGSVNTAFRSNSTPAPWKMQPEDIAQAVTAVLAMPARTLISAVEMRPSKVVK